MLGDTVSTADGSVFARTPTGDTPHVGPFSSPKANTYVGIPFSTANLITAGGDPSFRLFCTIHAAAGTPYLGASVTWVQLARTG